jgi:hypothetical protein
MQRAGDIKEAWKLIRHVVVAEIHGGVSEGGKHINHIDTGNKDQVQEAAKGIARVSQSIADVAEPHGK